MRSVILAALLVLSSSSAWSAVFSIGNGNVNRLVNVINQANRTPEPDTIRLAPGDYVLTKVNNDTEGPNGLPSITDHITIRGHGARIMTNEDTPGIRFFHVAASGYLALDDLTLMTNAYRNFSDPGSTILNQGSLNLSRVTVRGADRASNRTAAIWNPGSLVMTESTLEDNQTIGSGIMYSGGLVNQGTAIITRSVFRNNRAETSGGAIVNNGGRLWLFDSILQGNDAEGAGGGILNTGFSSGGFVHVENVTLTENDGCGAIYNKEEMIVVNTTVSQHAARSESSFCAAIQNSGHLQLLNVTVVANLVYNSGPEIIPGGLRNHTGTVIVKQSIIAGNVLRADTPVDCEGDIISQGFNLMGEGCPTNGPRDRQVELGDVFATLLGPLQDNGGPKVGAAFEPMLTHAPLPGSLAINAIPEEQCLLPRDQRGESRPDRFSDQCDIGAVEIANPEPPSCVLRFGDAPGFFLCEETPTTCAFNAFLDRGTCEQMCASLGSTCLGALDNDGDRCDLIPGSNDTCQTVRQTEICICSR